MQITRKLLRRMILEEVRILNEQEDEEDAAEDAPADEPAEEDTAADDEAADEAPAEDTEADDEKDAEEEKEPEVKVTPEEEAVLSKPVDDQILAYIIDFESTAVKSAKLVNDDQLQLGPDGSIPVKVSVESRWYRSSLSKLLFEDGGSIPGNVASRVGSPNIDMDVFASDVARLVMNYDSMIDMEALILNKAKNYLMSKYDKETADYFMEVMEIKHDMNVGVSSNIDLENEEPKSPLAVGSGYAPKSA